MLTLRETVFQTDGKTTITEKGFDTKNRIIKMLRKVTPLSNVVIYKLSKFDIVEFEHAGLKRKIEILKEEKASD